MTRFNLPEIDFVEVDAEEMENIAVSKFQELTGIVLEETDPRRKFIQSIAFLGTMIGNNIDFTGKMNLLAYAQDNYLDHKGIDKNVTRLEPRAAEVPVRFELNALEPFIIPAGVRMSVGEIEFATTSDVSVDIGTKTLDIVLTCTEKGTIGNGFLPNQITNIVDNDQLPWVVKAYNIDTSRGGLDWEDDESFAERIRQSNGQYSTAGPSDSYRYHTMSASSSIVDVEVFSPSEGRITVVPLLENGELPGQSLIDEIKEKLNERTIRPLTDFVNVELPEIVPYDIEFTYYIPRSKQSIQMVIQGQINQAVQDFITWQKSKLGRGIDSSELVSRIKEAGGVRVIVSSPSQYIVLSKTQVGHSNAVRANFGGLVDD
ncbi:baseplate J protein [Salmonella enterica subsp. enterica]|jgi:phage-related baseplate assembly protein|nr:baseplate J protein [Salmonella enterica subsp. enterica serovar Paratyphi A]